MTNSNESDAAERRLDALADSVSNRREFGVFLEALKCDHRDYSAEWENQTVAEYLQALVAYSHDIGGFFVNMGKNIDPDTPDWRVFAHMLLGARMYG